MCIIVLVNSFLRRILVVLPFRDLRQPGESSDRGEQIAWPIVVSHYSQQLHYLGILDTLRHAVSASDIHDGAREEIPVNVSRNSRHERRVQLDDVDGGIGEIGPAPRSRYRSRRPHAGRLAPAPSITGSKAVLRANGLVAAETRDQIPAGGTAVIRWAASYRSNPQQNPRKEGSHVEPIA